MEGSLRGPGDPAAEPGNDHEPAREPNDIGRLLLARMNAGDIDGVMTAEVARRQRDGTWRWTADQPNVQ